MNLTDTICPRGMSCGMGFRSRDRVTNPYISVVICVLHMQYSAVTTVVEQIESPPF